MSYLLAREISFVSINYEEFRRLWMSHFQSPLNDTSSIQVNFLEEKKLLNFTHT